MWKLDLLTRLPDGKVGPELSALCPAGARVLIGRRLSWTHPPSGAASDEPPSGAWRLDDDALATEQIVLRLPSARASGGVVPVAALLPGRKQSYLQVIGRDIVSPMQPGELYPLGDGDIVWLVGDPSGHHRHPIRMRRAPPDDSPRCYPAAATLPAEPSASAAVPAGGSDLFAPAIAAFAPAAPPGASISPGEWQVWLGGKYCSYDEGVNAKLEEALVARGKSSVRVRVGGRAYLVRRAEAGGDAEFEQVPVGQPSRARSVRRCRRPNVVRV